MAEKVATLIRKERVMDTAAAPRVQPEISTLMQLMTEQVTRVVSKTNDLRERLRIVMASPTPKGEKKGVLKERNSEMGRWMQDRISELCNVEGILNDIFDRIDVPEPETGKQLR